MPPYYYNIYMINIYPEEIGFVTTNKTLARQVFEDGIGLTLLSEGETSLVYRLNEYTQLYIFTDGRPHPLAQDYVSFSASSKTVLQTAKTVAEWPEGVRLKTMKDDTGQPFLFLTIDFPDGSDLSLSDQFWVV